MLPTSSSETTFFSTITPTKVSTLDSYFMDYIHWTAWPSAMSGPLCQKVKTQQLLLLQTNNHFSAKNKFSISEPNFTKSEQLDNFLFENDQSRKFFLFRKMVIVSVTQWKKLSKNNLSNFQQQEDGQKRKMVTKIEFTPLSDCIFFLFIKRFKKRVCYARD